MKPVRTDEELNRIIAEWCGWKPTTQEVNASGVWAAICGQWVDPHFPKYCTDLNAIHEAEKKLTKVLKPLYAETINNMLSALVEDYYTGWCSCRGSFSDAMFALTHATARQRAEALVAVIES